MEPISSIKMMDALINEQAANKKRISESGVRYRNSWSCVVLLNSGSERGDYVLILKPGLSRWQRWQFRYAHRNIRRFVLPWVRQPFTGMELAIMAGWTAFVLWLISRIPTDGSGPFWALVVLVLGVAFAPTVATLPLELNRARMWSWYAHLQGPVNEPSIKPVVEAIRNWPPAQEMPLEHWTRIHQLAKWAAQNYAGWANEIIGNVICEVMTAAAEGRPIANEWIGNAHKEETVNSGFKKWDRPPGEILELIRTEIADAENEKLQASRAGPRGNPIFEILGIHNDALMAMERIKRLLERESAASD